MHTLEKLTDKDELLDRAREHGGPFTYIDVRRWENQANESLSYDRRLREMVAEGKIKRISREESLLRGLLKLGRANIAYFELA